MHNQTSSPAPFPGAQTTGNTLQLEDIHYPGQPDFWPPAPGWWLLLFLLVVVFFLSVKKVRQMMRRRRELRETQQALDTLRRQLATGNRRQAITDLNIFLRKMALTHYPEENIASLTGEDWLRFLDRSGNTRDFTEGAGAILNEGPYRASLPENIDTDALINAVQAWVNNAQRKQPSAITLYPANNKTPSGGAV